MRKILFYLLLLLPVYLFAEEPDVSIPDLTDIDSLFDEEIFNEGNSTDSESAENDEVLVPEEEETTLASLFDDLSQKTPFDIHGNVRVLAGISGGYGKYPIDPDAEEIEYGDWEYSDMGVLKMNSGLSINARIAPEFRLYQRYTFAYPDFDLNVAELFVDYTFYNTLFFRIGRYTENWGRSRIFPFTNLPNRLIDDYNEDPDSFAAKLHYPIGVGGITLITFNRIGYFEDPEAPKLDELGLGGNFNAVFYGIDLTVGMFYQQDLQTRFYYTLGTTLFNKLEFYTEGLLSNYEHLKDGEFDSYRQDFSFNAGGYISFFDEKLQLNGEYYYNGESRNLLLKNRMAPLTEVPLIAGHNITAGFKWNLFNNKAAVYAQWLYNFDEDSGLIVPGIDVKTFPFVVISMKTPIIYGEPEGTYWQYNPDPEGRRILAALTIELKGSF